MNIESITETYIQSQIALHCNLREAAKKIGPFRAKSFDFSNLDNEKLEEFKAKNVLYLFRITNSKEGLAAKICDEITSLKSNKSFKSKLPKVNYQNTSVNGEENVVLYIGKSSGYFNTRLNQHLGNESEHTYALHLKRWLDHPVLNSIELELCWTTIDIAKYVTGKKQGQEFLEVLESGLHLCHKPILGRTGH
jgi:hypothetical protein